MPLPPASIQCSLVCVDTAQAASATGSADVSGKVRTYGKSEFFGEIALLSSDSRRTATVSVASDEATYLRLSASDIDDDMLHKIRAAASLAMGDMKFAGEMEDLLEDSREECASGCFVLFLPAGLSVRIAVDSSACACLRHLQCCASVSRLCLSDSTMRVPRRGQRRTQRRRTRTWQRRSSGHT